MGMDFEGRGCLSGRDGLVNRWLRSRHFDMSYQEIHRCINHRGGLAVETRSEFCVFPA